VHRVLNSQKWRFLARAGVEIKEEIDKFDANLCVDLSEQECKSRFKRKTQGQVLQSLTCSL
jgi:hypothetical protein